MEHSRSAERPIVLLLLAIALATFFFPLLTIQAPIVGTVDVSGYDIFSKINEVRKYLPTSSEAPDSSSATPAEPSRSSPVEPSASSLPISVNLVYLVPCEISLAFACALLALLGCFGEFHRSYVKTLSIVGGIAAGVAILHITIMNSDVHAWMQASMGDLKGNPFAGLASGLLSAFRLSPGSGLYALTAALALVAVISYSQVLSRPTAEESVTVVDVPARTGNGRPIAVGAFFIALVAVIVFALSNRQPSNVMNDREALLEFAQTCPLSHQWNMDFAGDGSVDRVEEHHCSTAQLSKIKFAKELEVDPQSVYGYDFLLVIEPRSVFPDKVVHGEYEAGSYSSVKPMVYVSQNIHAMVVIGEPWGSGGFASSCFLAQVDGKISCWKEQAGNFEKYVGKSLLPDESTDSWLLDTQNGKLFMESNVWASGDPHCCPTRGGIRVEFIPRDGILYWGKIERKR